MQTGRYALLAVLGLWATQGAADNVYKCVGSDGRLSYQARPCVQGQSQSTVTIHKAPSPPPMPTTKPNPPAPRSLRLEPAPRVAVPRPQPPPKPATSYKCTVQDGMVFYRHGGCPADIATSTTVLTDRVRNTIEYRPYTLRVTGEAVPRAEACAAINKLTTSSRNGYKLDDRVSTYDKNLGRDPCREY